MVYSPLCSTYGEIANWSIKGFTLVDVAKQSEVEWETQLEQRKASMRQVATMMVNRAST